MVGLGTIINTALVIAGGIVGLLFGKFISQRFQDILRSTLGVSVLFIGISGALEKMLVVTDSKVSTQGTLMMILSLVIGAIIGEIINIDGLINRFGEFLKEKSKSQGDNSFIKGFVTTSITICVGAMAVVGPINDALYGDISVLLAKSLLDCILVMIMAAAMGKGCIFSALPLALIQGFFTVIAKLVEPLLTPGALSNLSLVGSVLIFSVGVNLLWENKIKVANLLPAIIIAMAAAYVGL